MKGNNCSHKLRYERYLKLIYRCLSNNMYTNLTYIRILYGENIHVYGKTHMIVIDLIIRLEITKLSYIRNVIICS